MTSPVASTQTAADTPQPDAPFTTSLASSPGLPNSRANSQGATVLNPTPLTLSMQTDPAWAEPGDVLTYTVVAYNASELPLPNLILSDTLPSGLAYVPNSASGFLYLPSGQRLEWQLASLAAGEAITGSFQTRARGVAMGDSITNTVSASSPALTELVMATVSIDVVGPRSTESWATPGRGGWLRSLDGRVALHAPPGAVRARTRLTYTPRPDFPILPPHIFVAFELNAADEQGQAVHEFDAPLTLNAFFDPQQLPPGALVRLSLFTLNEASGAWEVVSSEVDVNGRRVSAQLSHFSVYGLGEETDDYNPPEFDPGPMIRGAQPSLFSGTIGYTYPFELPPGRGGLTPQLGLTYSSARHMGEIGHYSTVGHGWDILGENYVVRDATDPANKLITLVLNGATYSINSTTWVVKEDPFLRVEEFYETGDLMGLKVRTREGTLYHFQGYRHVNGASSLYSYPPMVYKWGGLACDGSKYPTWLRLPLVQAVDSSGNQINFSWDVATSAMQGYHDDSDDEPEMPGCGYVRTIRLTQISYNGDNVVVTLGYDTPHPGEGRQDRTEHYNSQGVHQFAIHTLNQVAVAVSGREIRRYELTYYPQSGGTVSEKTLALQSIKEVASGQFRATSLEYSTLALPTCQFGWLTRLTGPLGGAVTFSAVGHGNSCIENPQPPRAY